MVTALHKHIYKGQKEEGGHHIDTSKQAGTIGQQEINSRVNQN